MQKLKSRTYNSPIDCKFLSLISRNYSKKKGYHEKIDLKSNKKSKQLLNLKADIDVEFIMCNLPYNELFVLLTYSDDFDCKAKRYKKSVFIIDEHKKN